MAVVNGSGRKPRGQAFPKTFRLRNRSEFQRVQAYGRRFPTRDLIILWQEGRTGCTRLGVTVSKRVAKQAVRRNRIKRWIREAFRLLPDREASRALDVEIIARNQAVRSSFQAVAFQIQSFWRSQKIPTGGRRGA